VEHKRVLSESTLGDLFLSDEKEKEGQEILNQGKRGISGNDEFSVIRYHIIPFNRKLKQLLKILRY
jgi:hypothetical protein